MLALGAGVGAAPRMLGSTNINTIINTTIATTIPIIKPLPVPFPPSFPPGLLMTVAIVLYVNDYDTYSIPHFFATSNGLTQ